MARLKGIARNINVRDALRNMGPHEVAYAMNYHPMVELIKLASNSKDEKIKYLCHSKVMDYLLERKGRNVNQSGTVHVLHKMDERAMLNDLPRLFALELRRLQAQKKYTKQQTQGLLELEEVIDLDNVETAGQTPGANDQQDHSDGGAERSDLGGGEPNLPADGG